MTDYKYVIKWCDCAKGGQGEAFERFNFDHSSCSSARLSESHISCRASSHANVNVVDPCIYILDDEARAACVAYVSSVQHLDPVSDQPTTRTTFNTRLWLCDDKGSWKNVHYHRA